MNAGVHEQAWEPIVPLACPQLPGFPVDALPATLRRFVDGLAASTETAVDLSGVLVLTAVAASAAGKIDVRPIDGYVEPLNLWCLVALPPGERKSAVFRRVFAPLERAEARLREEAKPAFARAMEERAALERELANGQRRTAQRNAESEKRLAALRERLAGLHVKPLPRLLADDTTPEAVPQLLAQNDGRLCVASPEGGIISTLRGRYTPGMVNIDAFLKGHAGDTMRVDRRNAEAIIVERPALTFALAVQPAVLNELVQQKEFRGRGLVARFLFAVPRPRVGTRTYDASPLSEELARDYEATIERILFMRSAPLHTLSFTTRARETWRAFAVEVDRACGTQGSLVSLADWGSKLSGAVVRLAGVLHVAEVACDADLCEPVTEPTVQRAIDLGRYFSAHARAVYGADVPDERLTNALALVDWISRRRAFTVRDVQRSLKSRFPTADRARETIAILEEHGHVRARPPRGPYRGRPPSEVFDVHPDIAADETPIRAESGSSS